MSHGRPRKKTYTPEMEEVARLRREAYHAKKAERKKAMEEERQRQEAAEKVRMEREKTEESQSSALRSRSGRILRKTAVTKVDIKVAVASDAEQESASSGHPNEQWSRTQSSDDDEPVVRENTKSRRAQKQGLVKAPKTSSRQRKRRLEVDSSASEEDSGVLAAPSSFDHPPAKSFEMSTGRQKTLQFVKTASALDADFQSHFVEGRDSSLPSVSVHTKTATVWDGVPSGDDFLCSTAKAGTTLLAFVGGPVFAAEAHPTWPVLSLSAHSSSESHHPIGKTCVGETWLQFWTSVEGNVSFSHASRLGIGFVRQMVWVDSQLAVVGGDGGLTLVQFESFEGISRKAVSNPAKSYQADSFFQTAVTWSPRRKQIITGTSDGSILVWSIDSSDMSQSFFSFHGHLATVRCIAVNDDLGVFATAGDDGHVNIWKFGIVNRPMRKIQLGVCSVTALRWMGKSILAGTTQGGIHQYSIKRGEVTDHAGMQQSDEAVRSHLGFRKSMVWDFAARKERRYRNLMYVSSSDGAVAEYRLRQPVARKKRTANHLLELSSSELGLRIKVLGGVEGPCHVKDRAVGSPLAYPTKLIWWEPGETGTAWLVVLSSGGYATFLPVER